MLQEQVQRIIKKKEWLSYEEAKEKIQSLYLRSDREYNKLSKQGKLPKWIPSGPHRIYKNKGWIGWVEFLGYEFLPFDRAREEIQRLEIQSFDTFKRLSRQGKIPKDIPRNPYVTYKDYGWTNWYDFLGNSKDRFPPFEKVREEIQKLGIQSGKEYRRLHREGKLSGYPAQPDYKYKNKGWASWIDFLGYSPKWNWLPFDEAKKIIITYGFQNALEYFEYSKQGKLPELIPSAPQMTYKGKGWIDWSDFLGKKRHSKPLPFKEARKIVRTLGIKNNKQYQKLFRQGKLPKGLPSNLIIHIVRSDLI